jgi:hypothetical protein
MPLQWVNAVRVIIALYSQNHVEHTDAPCGINAVGIIKTALISKLFR